MARAPRRKDHNRAREGFLRALPLSCVEQLRRWRAAENTALRTRIKAGVLEYVNCCGTEYLPTIFNGRCSDQGAFRWPPVRPDLQSIAHLYPHQRRRSLIPSTAALSGKACGGASLKLASRPIQQQEQCSFGCLGGLASGLIPRLGDRLAVADGSDFRVESRFSNLGLF